jgi:serine/threonine protein kinase
MNKQSWQKGDVLLEQYEVLGTLGEGGMGTVYKVHHRGWNIDLAVKSPRPALFAWVDGKENFMREAETWVILHLHPHIVSCYYVRLIDGIPRIFAEYVAGGSLADWIRSRRLYEGGSSKPWSGCLTSPSSLPGGCTPLMSKDWCIRISNLPM